MSLTFYATKTNQTGLKYEAYESYLSAIRSIPDGSLVSITISTEENKSSAQVRFYHGVIVKAVRSYFFDNGSPLSIEDTDKELRRLYKEQFGIEVSISSFTKKEMSHFIGWIVDYVNDFFGLTIEPYER